MKCFIVGARHTLGYSRKLQELADEMPADRRDRFVVIPETGDTAVYWQAADVFCCTSRVESYPLVILEAMAAGLPIVTTPVHGIAEQVRPGVNALFYQPGDINGLGRQLAALAQDESLRRSLAEASPHVLRSLPDHVRMCELYRRHLQGRRRERGPGRGHRGPRNVRPRPDVVRRLDSRPGGIHEPYPCRRPDRELDSRDGQDARRRVTGWSTAGW